MRICGQHEEHVLLRQFMCPGTAAALQAAPADGGSCVLCAGVELHVARAGSRFPRHSLGPVPWCPAL